MVGPLDPLKVALLAAIARIRSEVDMNFDLERNSKSREEQNEKHNKALGLGRAVEIINDFTEPYL